MQLSTGQSQAKHHHSVKRIDSIEDVLTDASFMAAVSDSMPCTFEPDGPTMDGKETSAIIERLGGLIYD